MHWSEIDPADAWEGQWNLLDRPDILPPLNEKGEPCPWPWESMELLPDPDRPPFPCSYCGAMCTAGQPHPDYRKPE